MKWLVWIIIGSTILLFFVLKRMWSAGPAVVSDSLRRGAKVIDVRTEAEYRERHLPGAINIPLNQLSSQISRYVPDKDQPVLLHCLSGGRSGIGTGILKRMGYRQCYNLGSLERARNLLEAAARDPEAGKTNADGANSSAP